MVHKLYMGIITLVPRRSLLTSCQREVWERVNESLSVTSQLTVEFRIDLTENGKGIGWVIRYVGQKFTTRSASVGFGTKISTFEHWRSRYKFHSQFLAV